MAEPLLLDNGRIVLYQGDCLQILPKLPEGSVQCCVSSPPYFALRSYLPKDHPLKGQEIGSEPTPESFIETMVRVFRDVRRVMRDDGVLFLNLGDSMGRGTRPNWKGDARRDKAGLQNDICAANGYSAGRELPDGQLQNIPHRVAEALRADGWVWRQTVVWHKRSPMPESVAGWRYVRCGKRSWPNSVTGADSELRRDRQQGRDFGQPVFVACPGCPKCEPNGGYVLRRGAGRCTTAHEYLFIMAKTGKYFWDSAASAEDGTYPAGTNGGKGSLQRAVHQGMYGAVNCRPPEYAIYTGKRNPRSVWTLSSEPTSIRHFATFPSELVRRCLVAGISAGGCCPVCEAPFAPVVESERVATRPGRNAKSLTADGGENLDPRRHVAVGQTLGYRPTCRCKTTEPPKGCLVLDPFAGIGTVAQTANALACRSIGIELNPAYVAEAAKRVLTPPRWLIRQQARERRQAGRAFASTPPGVPLFKQEARLV